MRIFAVLLLLVISSVSIADPIDTTTSPDLIHKVATDKEAKLKAAGRIVKELAYSSTLDKNQVSTWCQRRIPEIIDSFSSGPNKLISIGECTCKILGIVSMEQQYECEFPYSYSDGSQLTENTQKPTQPQKTREKNAAVVSKTPAPTANKKIGISGDEQKKLDADKNAQLAVEKAQKEEADRQKLEEKRLADINDSQKRHSCRHIVTASGNGSTEADARAQIHLESAGNTGITGAGDPYTVDSSTITCKKQTTKATPEYKCIGKQVNNVKSIGACGASTDSQGTSK